MTEEKYWFPTRGVDEPVIRTEITDTPDPMQEVPSDLPIGARIILPDETGGMVYIDLEGIGRVSLAEYRIRKLGPG